MYDGRLTARVATVGNSLLWWLKHISVAHVTSPVKSWLTLDSVSIHVATGRRTRARLILDLGDPGGVRDFRFDISKDSKDFMTWALG